MVRWSKYLPWKWEGLSPDPRAHRKPGLSAYECRLRTLVATRVSEAVESPESHTPVSPVCASGEQEAS